jgi:glycosyltransferase involved in cell wall biosynthesis
MKNKSRTVLVVTSEFPPMPGGIGNHAYNLCVYLVRSGYSVKVLTNKRAVSDAIFNEFISANANLSITALERSSNPLFTYLKRVQAYKKLLAEKPDKIIFSGKFSIWLAALGWHKSRSWGVIHGSEIKQEGLKKSWFKRGLDRLTGIISVSGFTQEHLLQAFPHLTQQHCVVINNGFDLPKYEIPQRAIIPGHCHLITVGGMHRRKGQHNIIAALPSLKQIFPHIQYTIAGLPETMDALQELAKSLGVEKHVCFVPNPSRDELVALLQEAHVFAMLSENLPNGDIEGFGIAILEGMSLGLPAIGSKNSGIRDAVDHRQSGILINNIHDSAEIVEALKTIMANYAGYSEKALTWSERFRWSFVIQQYLNELEKP